MSKGSGIYTNNQVKIAGWGQIIDTFDYREYDYWGDYYDDTIGADYSINNSGTPQGSRLRHADRSTGGIPSSFTIYDYIISPLVSGNVDFKIKLSTSKGSIEVKKATLNAATANMKLAKLLHMREKQPPQRGTPSASTSRNPQWWRYV